MPANGTAARLLVIGSGPAGVSCAFALAKRGLKPLVIDGGRRLESERETALRDATGPERMDPSFIAELERAFPVDVDRLPLKPAFGSLFPYAVNESLLQTRAPHVGVVQSVGLGGLSNVWGAAILPFRDRDLRGWPFPAAELVPYYRSTFSFLPLAGERDELEELFPLYGEPESLTPTAQIQAILNRLRARGTDLRAAGLVSGRARLAVAAGGSKYATPCRYTGLCMYGCPYGSIYNAASTLHDLVEAGRVDYRPGWIVDRLEETGGLVHVNMRSLNGGSSETLTAERVFVAGGVLGSTRIVLESLAWYDRPLALLESAYYTLPLVTWSRPARVGRGLAGNTLAQIFLELDDPDVSAHGVHLQVYGYSDLMLRAVAARSHLGESVSMRLLQPLLGRLLFAGGYLHSDDSPRLSAELVRESSGSVLMLSPGDGAATAGKVKAVIGKLRSLRPLTGISPLAPMSQIWPQGKGFHVGGSFPMRERPEGLESDLLGRPAGLRRVHVVDASVLPSLPATTITLSAMANAQRIAAEHDQD
jgi:choline dehydrogenase-like flavoprotein